VDAIGIDDNEVVVESSLGVWALLVERVTQLNTEAEALEGHTFEIVAIPFLCRSVRPYI
jgi:hypothetical protein